MSCSMAVFKNWTSIHALPAELSWSSTIRRSVVSCCFSAISWEEWCAWYLRESKGPTEHAGTHGRTHQRGEGGHGRMDERIIEEKGEGWD